MSYLLEMKVINYWKLQQQPWKIRMMFYQILARFMLVSVGKLQDNYRQLHNWISLLGQLTQLRKSLCCHLSTISKFDSKLLHSCLESMQQSVIRWWEFFLILSNISFKKSQVHICAVMHYFWPNMNYLSVVKILMSNFPLELTLHRCESCQFFSVFFQFSFSFFSFTNESWVKNSE